MPFPTLNDFTRLAGQTDASRLNTTFLKVRGGRLVETGRLGNFFTTQATRRATMSAFADALRARYGDYIADLLDDYRMIDTRNGKTPLSAREVRFINQYTEDVAVTRRLQEQESSSRDPELRAETSSYFRRNEKPLPTPAEQARAVKEAAAARAASEQSEFEETMADTVGSAFGNILRARDAGEARAQLDALGDFMLSAAKNHPPLAKKSPRALAPVMEHFMAMGTRRFSEWDGEDGRDMQTFAAAIRRPGPFRDMLHALAREKSASAQAARTTMQWFVKGLAGALPDEALQACDGSRIRERDLSLARQREILGAGVHAARGAETASELAGLNESMREDMPGMEHFIRDAAETYLRDGPPSGPRTSLGLSHQFHVDFPRRGVFVDGIYHRSHSASGFYNRSNSELGFIDLFPDSRTAGLLSNLATQSLPAFFQDAVMHEKAASSTTRQAFVRGALGNPSLTGSDNEETFNVRIETLDRSAGRYRIVGLHGRSTTNPKSAVERYMYEVAVDVNLGAPGADARSSPPPSVENVHADFLIRGRETVPGERNT